MRDREYSVLKLIGPKVQVLNAGFICAEVRDDASVEGARRNKRRE